MIEFLDWHIVTNFHENGLYLLYLKFLVGTPIGCSNNNKKTKNLKAAETSQHSTLFYLKLEVKLVTSRIFFFYGTGI